MALGARLAYFARHGETLSNRVGRYAGRAADGLTDEGRQQMQDAAALLEALDGSPGEIWTSEIARARESATILSRALSVPVRDDARLNEMLFGPWEGLTEAEIAEHFPREFECWQARPDELILPGRETLEELAERACAVVSDALDAPVPVVLVTHVALIRVASLRALDLPLGLYKRLRVPNASLFALGGRGAGVRRLDEPVDVLGEVTRKAAERSVA